VKDEGEVRREVVGINPIERGISKFINFVLTLIMKGEDIMAVEPTTRILQAAGGHTIEVIGGNRISDKLFNIVAMMFTAGEWFGEYQFNKITFAENEPIDKYGGYLNETKEIIINLQRHFDGAVKNLQTENEDINAKYLSLPAAIWYDILATILHEGFHGIIWNTSPERAEAVKTDPVQKEEIENECNSHARAMLFDLFRDFDMEPPPINQEPFFGFRFMKFFIDHIKDGGEDWAVRQNIMLETNLIYYDEEDTDGIPTMREWLMSCADGDPEFVDERWEKKPKPILNVMVNPGVMVEKVLAVGATETPITKEVQVRQEAQVPVVVSTAMAPVSEFVQASDDVVMASVMNSAVEDGVMELEMDLDESPYYDDNPLPNGESLMNEAMDEMMAPEMAEMKAALATQQPIPTPVQQPLPIPVVEGAKFCHECGQPVGEAMAPGETKTACIFGNEVKLSAFGQSPAPAAVPAPEFVQAGVPTQPQPVTQTEFIAAAGPVGGATQKKFTQSLRNDLPNIGMNVADMKRILEEVYRRMHEHCFTKCGFQLSGGQTGNATAWHPAYAGNVLQPINIADIPGATDLIIAIDKNEPATGKTMMKHPITDGCISGKITKNEEPVPSYAIYINNNGIEQKRIFMVQKAFKTTASGYSGPAIRAQQGNQISWVWDGADQLNGRRRWIYKIENGVAEWLV